MKGKVDKLLGIMRLNDDDYEDDYEDYEDYEEVDEDEEKEKKSIFSFRRDRKVEEEEEEEPQPVVMETPKRQQYRRTSNKVVSMNGQGVEVQVIKPVDFGEAKQAADYLREGKTIVINMEGVPNPEAQRTIDFIGGACYAVDGTLQAISKNIFIAAPDNIEVSGDLRDEIMNDDIVSPRISE
ncbi:MAG: cell division protein SepF [Lachnospiraceae bacterium]|nr:cell division protein SepF [Lachnospiraceae bacterium]